MLKSLIRFISAVSIAAMLHYAQPARASLENPLNDVQSSSPTDTILLPSGYGNGTGAGGNVLSNTWFASTTDGWLLKYDGKTFQNAIDTGLPGLSGVDVRPDGSLVLSYNEDLQLGTVSGNTWNPTSTITLYGLTSGITDVSEGYGMADFFVASGNGVYAVRNGSLGEQVSTSILRSYDAVKLNPAMYTSNLACGDGKLYKEADNSGQLFGPGKIAAIPFDDVVNGSVNLKNYQIVVQPDAFQVLNPQGFSDGIQVPEPATMLLVATGGMYLLTRKNKN